MVSFYSIISFLLAFPVFALCRNNLVFAAKTFPVVGKVKVDPKQLKVAGVAGKLTSATITLNQGEYETILRQDNSFIFHNIPGGTYTVDVSHPVWVFGQVKIELNAEKNGRVRAIMYKFPGADRDIIDYPLVLSPLGNTNYFKPRPAFSIMSLFANPMILMMGVMGLMAFCMPKMLDNMSEEDKVAMQEQMRTMQGLPPKSKQKGIDKSSDECKKVK